jgi:hypothetical protein
MNVFDFLPNSATEEQIAGLSDRDRAIGTLMCMGKTISDSFMRSDMMLFSPIVISELIDALYDLNVSEQEMAKIMLILFPSNGSVPQEFVTPIEKLAKDG